MSLHLTSVDVWSVGCILAEMLSNKPLFPGKHCILAVTCIIPVFVWVNHAKHMSTNAVPSLNHILSMWCEMKLKFLSLTLSPRKAEKPDSPTVRNSHKAEIPACRSLIYSCKAEISAWKFRKKLLQIMLCMGAPGLGTPCCGEVKGERVNALQMQFPFELFDFCMHT